MGIRDRRSTGWYDNPLLPLRIMIVFGTSIWVCISIMLPMVALYHWTLAIVCPPTWIFTYVIVR